MRIYKMTAAFGRLEQQTLTLEPGLNIIEAPNEWGKSTWCAFLLAMFYGLDTRAKTTKSSLADKEKYVPWSGSSMAGRIDLHWQGRDITIERSTRGRVPMGQFRAYETKSGLAVPELTAATCGRLLLGVEQSVYRRTAFLRQADLPVTQDDALRRRLNALVTTGDESGDSDRLLGELKELKNKIRYNRSGLLPQAEQKRKALEEKQAELETMESHSRKLRERLGEGKAWQQALVNHQEALNLAAAEADALRVAQARDLRDRAEEALNRMEQKCASQPDRQETERKLAAMEAWRQGMEALRSAETELQQQPVMPEPPEPFRDLTPEAAAAMVDRDARRHEALKKSLPWLIFVAAAVAALLLCAGFLAMRRYLWAGTGAASGALLLLLGLGMYRARNRELEALEETYGSGRPELWEALLLCWQKERSDWERRMQNYRSGRGDLDIQAAFLQKQRLALFGDQSPERVMAAWQQIRDQWRQRDEALRTLQQAQEQLKLLQEMAKPMPAGTAAPDSLTYDAQQTRTLLAEARAEQQHLQNRLGQYQGRMEALGSAEALAQQLAAVNDRIGRLEQTYAALTLALETLAQARQELQRRFAPRIVSRARELMEAITAGRYHRLTLQEDLSLLAEAGGEGTLRELLWRSDGTMDQLYVALRLAVAEELTPDAPLVLDDAFVRFDDERLKAAMDILRQTAQRKQVILFTCHSREKQCAAEYDRL